MSINFDHSFENILKIHIIFRRMVSEPFIKIPTFFFGQKIISEKFIKNPHFLAGRWSLNNFLKKIHIYGPGDVFRKIVKIQDFWHETAYKFHVDLSLFHARKANKRIWHSKNAPSYFYSSISKFAKEKRIKSQENRPASQPVRHKILRCFVFVVVVFLVSLCPHTVALLQSESLLVTLQGGGGEVAVWQILLNPPPIIVGVLMLLLLYLLSYNCHCDAKKTP